MTSFFRIVDKRSIYWLGLISLAHTPVHVTDLPVVNVHVDELSSARIWQHKLCATLSADVNINYRLPIKVYCRICPLRYIGIEIIHGSHKCVLSFNMGWRILVFYSEPTHVKTQNTFWQRNIIIWRSSLPIYSVMI
jgi:hypothetical protein